jgi:hypothetical protein
MTEKPTDFDPSHVGDGALTLLKSLVEAEIERDSATCSTMVRAGLLLDLINEVQTYRAAPNLTRENIALREAVKDAYLEGWRLGYGRGKGQGPSNTPMQDWADSDAALKLSEETDGGK